MRGKTLRHSSELTLLANIKAGEVPIGETMTYATRLRLLLDMLFSGREQDTERDLARSFRSVVDTVGLIHFVRWTLLDRDTKLLLAVAFDGTWESYLHDIEVGAHGLLDLIFSHCEGYEERFRVGGYRGFSEWVEPRQVESSFWYASRADLTVKDVHYLSELRRHVAAGSPPERIAELNLNAPETFVAPPRTDPPSALAKAALMRLRERFPPVVIEGAVTHQSLYDEMLREIGGILEPRTEPEPAAPVDLGEEAANIQGNILTPYRAITHGSYVLLQVTDAARARATLASLDADGRTSVTTEARSQQARGEVGDALNLALTASGLQALEVPLREFPSDFLGGMQARSPSLGDIGHNHPDFWKPPAPLEAIDVVVTFQTSDPGADFRGGHGDAWLDDPAHPLNTAFCHLTSEESGFALLARQPLRRTFFRADGTPLAHEEVREFGRSRAIREHFGFHDGVSQPVPNVTGLPEIAGDACAADVRPLSEFLLGYDPNYACPELLANGSFLAMRKLRQNVAAFDRYVEQSAQHAQVPAPTIRAMLMGRYDDGCPVSAATDGASDPTRFNDFAYDSADDRRGRGCPLQAHARLANPRTSPALPRIVRRGFSYGPRYAAETAADERGLMFLTYNTSLSQQFEVVQRWLSGGNITGVLSSMNDPLLGTRDPNPERPPFTFTLWARDASGDSTPKCLPASDEPLVTLEWGLYAFAPSLAALAAIARGPQAPSKRAPQERPPSDSREGVEVTPEQWQQAAADAPRLLDLVGRADAASIRQLIEDPTLRRAGDRTLWGAAMKVGALPTRYATLVAGSKAVRATLADSKSFSVAAYDERLQRTLGQFYLGYDSHTEQYQKESTLPNEYMRALAAKDAFDAALKDSRLLLGALTKSNSPVVVPDFAAAVVALRCRAWFGVPDGRHLAVLPSSYAALSEAFGVGHGELGDFYARYRAVSLDAFFPNPSQACAADAREQGRALNAAVSRIVTDRWDAGAASGGGTLADVLIQAARSGDLAAISGADLDAQRTYVTRLVAGSTSATVVATVGSLISVVAQWVLGKRFGRLQRALRRHGEVDARLADPHSWLMKEVLFVLSNRPVPELLHRRATGRCPIGAQHQTSPGETLAVNLSTAALQERAAPGFDGSILFGGSPSQGQVHACPGMQAALGTLSAMVTALLEQPHLSAHTGDRFVLSRRMIG